MRQSVIFSILRQVCVLFAVALLVIAYFWVRSEFIARDEANQQYAHQYLEEEKARLKSEVLRVRDYLLREKAEAESQLQLQLKSRVEEALQITAGIYEQNRGLLSRDQIEARIVEALRHHRFNDSRGYFFVDTLDGIAVLYPPKPENEGKYPEEIFGPRGIRIIEQILTIARGPGEGFLNYRWYLPDNSERLYKKYSYVKTFEPLNWVIGTGGYLELFEQRLQQQLYRDIADIRYGAAGEGYYFINSYTGDLWVTNGEYFDGQRNLWELADLRGEKVVQENARIAQENPEGGFNRYFWRKNDGTEAEKISYVIGMDEWDIFIGAGAWLDTIEQQIARNSDELHAQVTTRITGTLALILIAVLAVALAIWMIGRKLTLNFTLFRDAFEHSVDNRVPINESEIYFSEFKALARGANDMIDGLNSQAEELRQRAFYDHLTELPNRLQGASHLEDMIRQSQQQGALLALLFIDLDNFKEINDTFGHSAGDEVLREVSDRLRAAVRSDDSVARLGGDEFTVVTGLLHCRSDAELIAAKLLRVLEQPLTVDHTEISICASIGISLCPDHGDSAEQLMRNADAAMYNIKGHGKNGFSFYDPAMSEEVSHRMALGDALTEAIDQQQFLLHYQPQIDLRTGNVTGAEALIRWQHPERGLILPGDFIPYAESSGQIEQIGEWVLKEACSRLRDWQQQGIDVGRLAVNVSAIQVHRRSLGLLLPALLKETGVDPHQLELELTERVLMEDPENSSRELKTLQLQGISVAIDDFGTGYSSLGYLKNLHISKLKIDSSFIAEMHRDASDRAIIRAIIALGRSLGLTVVAEGVENRQQEEFLRDEGCCRMQGFYLSKPLSEDEFLAFIGRRGQQASYPDQAGQG